MMHRSHVREPWIFELFSHESFHGVEAALWPHLYHDNSLCESFLEGQESRKSGKVSFMTKIASPIWDYATNYDLLHYHYDRWLFKTITGAINSAKQAQCSPATALEAKTFSHQYWRNQHRYLIDAVRQFGFPSIFITISPFEWSFPCPPWLDHLRNKTGKDATELAIPETIHIAHVLEYIRGYLCGSNTNRWKNHLLAKKSDPSANNVTNYFYRFEFQKRGTPHAHILIWLDNMTEIDVTQLSATIPWGNVEKAFLVYDLQKSRTSSLPLRQGPNRVLTENNQTYLAFHHSRSDKGCNLHAFVPAVTGSLQCSMDVQSSDGKAMLLKYVTSYVAKCHDAVKTQQLYSVDLGAYQAATSFLKNMHPLEPEMVLQLTSMKIALTNSRTKPFTAPTPGQTQHKVHLKYLGRPANDEHLTFLQWLREYDHDKNPPKRYKDGSTLVGVKHLSPFNPIFFYQLLIMNLPHRTLDELNDLREERLPEPIKHFVPAREKLPHILGSRETILEYLSSESHKRSYLETIVLYIQSLQDIYALWQLGVIDCTFASSERSQFELQYPLSPQQRAIYSRYLSLVETRRRSIYGTWSTPASRSTQEVTDPNSSDYAKYQLLLGCPGTGKTQVVKRLIHTLIEEEYSVAVCAPLGLLATNYREEFYPDLQADTIHALYNIPVAADQEYVVNYNIGKYDAIIIDEASMVADNTFDMIHDTLEKQAHRPLVIIAGDECQQPPLQTINGRTTQTTSILKNRRLREVCQVHSLYQQFRCTDKAYMDFLQYIRYSRPEQYVLDNFKRPLLLFRESDITNYDIWHTLQDAPDATFLTVSRAAANRVNNIVIRRGFENQTPVSTIPLENDAHEFLPFRDMRVVVTQDLDKRTSVVNGQLATILNSHNNTLLLKFPNGKTTFTHPITTISEDGRSRVHYALNPAYCMTICKTQGANIRKLLLWFDCPTVPSGMGYVALSRVRKSEDIKIMTPIVADQLNPALS